MKKILSLCFMILLGTSLLTSCTNKEMGTAGGAALGSVAGYGLTGGNPIGAVAGAVGGGLIGHVATKR